jgi:mannosyltransferase, putative
MTLYIDFTGDSLGNDKIKYHGGGDFSRYITNKFNDYIKSNKIQIKIIVIWPKHVDEDSMTREEKRIREQYSFIDTENIADIQFVNSDILFFPLLDTLSVSKIGEVRKKHKNLKIYGVLHGVRLLDSCKYDKYDRFYFSGLKSNPLILWLRRWCAGILGLYQLKVNIPKANRIYTVSNCSMQKINQLSKPVYIKYFTRDITNHCADTTKKQNKNQERFILFVNSNRYEKNFIRSLLAFCKYQERHGTDLKLRVLGMNRNLENNLKKIKELNWDIIHDKVIFENYVSEEQLRGFYETCDFLLYTTKSEGYGLPPLEAMNAGRPTVASSYSSVPEVLGMGAYYVNPYEISDIVSGIEFMAQKDNQNKYVEKLQTLKDIIVRKGREDIKQLVEEVLA